MELPGYNNMNVYGSGQLSSWNTASANPHDHVSQQTIGQLFRAYAQVLTRLDDINHNLQRLEFRMNRVEHAQAQIEEIVRNRISSPVPEEKMVSASALMALSQPIPSNKRPAENAEIQETNPKRLAEAITHIKDIAFQELQIDPQTSEELIRKYKAETISSSEVHVVDQDTRVVDNKGNILVIYIKHIDHEKHLAAITKIMKESKHSSFNSTSRGDAGGKFDASTLNKNQSLFTLEKNPVRAKKQGSTYVYSNRHPSITLGYLSHDRSKHLCREVSKNNKVSFQEIIPLLADIGNVYAKFAPKNHQAQRQALEAHKLLAGADGIHCQIADTPFTTLTVNNSKDGKPTTFFHKDTNTLKGSLACLFVYGNNYGGGETAFPELPHPETKKPIAFDVRPGGLLIFDGRVLLHGNTPVKLEAGGNRVSFVAYTQQVLTDCTTCKTSMAEAKPE